MFYVNINSYNFLIELILVYMYKWFFMGFFISKDCVYFNLFGKLMLNEICRNLKEKFNKII